MKKSTCFYTMCVVNTFLSSPEKNICANFLRRSYTKPNSVNKGNCGEFFKNEKFMITAWNCFEKIHSKVMIIKMWKKKLLKTFFSSFSSRQLCRNTREKNMKIQMENQRYFPPPQSEEKTSFPISCLQSLNAERKRLCNAFLS